MTGETREDEGVEAIREAAEAVMADAAREGRHLLLRQEGDGTYRMRAELSREGVANLLRLLAAVEGELSETRGRQVLEDLDRFPLER